MKKLVSPLPEVQSQPTVWIPVGLDRAPDESEDSNWYAFGWEAKFDPGLDAWCTSIPRKHLERMKAEFAPLDVEWELKCMRDWCEEEVAKRKTYNGMKTFITRWLRRSYERRLQSFDRDDLEEAEAIRHGLAQRKGSRAHNAALFDLRVPYRRRVLDMHGDPYGWPYWEPRLVMRRVNFKQFLKRDGAVDESCHEDMPVKFSCYQFLNQRDIRDLNQQRSVWSGESFYPLAEWILRDGWPLLLRTSPYKEDFSPWCKREIEALVRRALKNAK